MRSVDRKVQCTRLGPAIRDWIRRESISHELPYHLSWHQAPGWNVSLVFAGMHA